MTREERRQMWTQRVEAFLAGGQSTTEWCAQHDINPNQLRYWLRKLRDQEKEGTSPQWLSVAIDSGGQSPEGALRVRVGPAAIEVAAGYDPRLLKELVATLSELC